MVDSDFCQECVIDCSPGAGGIFEESETFGLLILRPTVTFVFFIRNVSLTAVQELVASLPNLKLVSCSF